MTLEHELKVWPELFARLSPNGKTFEVRKNDRDFQVNDMLILREFNPENGSYGKVKTATITYILHGGQFGIEPGYVVLQLDFHPRHSARYESEGTM